MISRNNESAVSPIVGVMLMLVVTIIIAAVVSAFAGGLSTSERKTPQAVINAEVILGDGIQGSYASSYYTYPTGYTCDNNYVLFAHDGGDGFNLNDIYVVFDNEGNKYTIEPSDKPIDVETYGVSCRDQSDWDSMTYFEEIGTGADNYIRTGDKFILHFDGNYAKTSSTTGITDKWLNFYKYGAASIGPTSTLTGKFGFPATKNVKWMIVDRYSGKIIASGEVNANA